MSQHPTKSQYEPGNMKDAAVLCMWIVAFVSSYSDLVESSSYDWGPWTTWSSCTETCGYGTAYRIRQCHAQLRYGRACEGPHKQYQICQREVCGRDKPDYRTRECAKNNTVYYGHRTYTWIPYINEMAPCELSCKSRGYGYYARFKTSVEDGVICSENNTAICMQGICTASGCDGVIGSGTQLDRCGVCDGDGTSCRLFSGIFTRTHLTHRGYNVVYTIPAGACSINVTEMRRSMNYLALSTPSGYFFNGNMRLQATGSVKGAGTVFTYKRNAGPECPGECLTAPGPLNSSLTVELIYFSRNPGIVYKYTLQQTSDHDVSELSGQNSEDDKEMTSTHRSQPSRDHRHGGRSRHDGAGSTYSRRRDDILPRIKHGLSPQYIPNKNSNHRHREQLRGRDQRSSTTSSSLTSSASAITNYGNNHGVRNRSTSGRRSWRQERPKLQPQIRIHTSKRPNTQPKPREENRDRRRYRDERVRSRHREPHNIKPSINVGYEPNADQFYIPSANSSIQYQHYYHTNVHDGLGVVPVASDQSHDTTTGGQRTPWAESAVSAENRYAEFRSTTQYQPASRDLHPNIIASSSVVRAPPRARPPNHRWNNAALDNRLSSRSGLGDVYSWRISGFTQCTEPCGGGFQETRIVCVNSDSQVEVMNENCDVNRRPKSTTVICNDEPCDASWSIGQWSECSVTCGRGLQKRVVQCQQRISSSLTIQVSASNCPRPKPQWRQFCQLEDCFLWKPSNWSKCSSECGLGQRSRSLRCEDRRGENVTERLCRHLRKLSVEEICDMGSCAEGWFHTRWTNECTTMCGRGDYTRLVYCSAPDGSPLDQDKCGGKESKPRDKKKCRSQTPCGGQWFAGPWSKCNATCGVDAYRQRQVLCVKRHGKRVNHVVKAHNCAKEDRPVEKEWCGTKNQCHPQWFMMSWSKCSKPCGTGVMIRELKCLDTTLTPSPNCVKSDKPRRRQPCNFRPCRVTELTTPMNGDITSTQNNEALQMDDQFSSPPGRDCIDKRPSTWCYAAGQARLCGYPHYQEACCGTCKMLQAHESKQTHG